LDKRKTLYSTNNILNSSDPQDYDLSAATVN